MSERHKGHAQTVVRDQGHCWTFESSTSCYQYHRTKVQGGLSRTPEATGAPPVKQFVQQWSADLTVATNSPTGLYEITEELVSRQQQPQLTSEENTREKIPGLILVKLLEMIPNSSLH